MHHFEHVLVLNLNLHPDVIRYLLQGDVDGFQVTVSLAYVNQHCHDEVTIHDPLADVFDVDVALVQEARDSCNNPLLVLADYGDEKKFLVHQ